MEKDLGFGNGYLNPKKVNDIKMGRLFAILDYLGVSRAEFFGEDTVEAETERMIRQREDLRDSPAKRMLFDAAENAPESDILESLAVLMRRKIGIDCAGNVFACAWGGYLPDTAVADNPLFLGNLLRQDLTEILDNNTSDNYKKINNWTKKKNENYCPVASITCGGKLSENRDPLAKKPVG